MRRIAQLKPEFVEFIPDRLEQGIIYISPGYSTATHLCCCGCGQEVVTPLKPAKWHLRERNGAVWLRPSVGNWSFPCRSHNWTYAFARIGAVVGMRVEDYYPEGKRWWVRLHEKGGKRHEMPAHHKLEAFIDEYLAAAGIRELGKPPSSARRSARPEC